MSVFNLSALSTSETRLRVISAVVLAPIVLGIALLGGSAFSGLIGLITSAGLYEWLRLVDPDVPKTDGYAMFAALIFILALTAAGLPVLSFVVLALSTAAFYAHRSNIDPPRAVWFAFGLPYMAGSGMALIALRNMPVVGLGLIAYLFAVTWGMDIGAYVFGRLIGGPKLAPRISPNKTWAGFFGGIVLAVILAGLVMLVLGVKSYAAGLLVAILLAVTVQGGDLFKSFFKRRAGVKDCGNLIPGHGGVLDRVDGLIVAAMVLALLLMLFGNGMMGLSR